MLIKNDVTILKWIFDSVNESFQENKPVEKLSNTSFSVSVEIIEALSEFYSADKSETSLDMPDYILNSFELYVTNLDKNSVNTECLLRFLDCMRITAYNLYKVKRFKKLDRLVELLLDLVAQDSNVSSNLEIILKISFVFKVYATK